MILCFPVGMKIDVTAFTLATIKNIKKKRLKLIKLARKKPVNSLKELR